MARRNSGGDNAGIVSPVPDLSCFLPPCSSYLRWRFDKNNTPKIKQYSTPNLDQKLWKSLTYILLSVILSFNALQASGGKVAFLVGCSQNEKGSSILYILINVLWNKLSWTRDNIIWCMKFCTEWAESGHHLFGENHLFGHHLFGENTLWRQ